MKTNALESLPSIRASLKSAQAPRPDADRPSFGETMNQALESVNRLQKAADGEIEALAAGRNGDLHRTMIALEKADISFQLLMQVRNKIVAAYQEIMRMQF